MVACLFTRKGKYVAEEIALSNESCSVCDSALWTKRKAKMSARWGRSTDKGSGTAARCSSLYDTSVTHGQRLAGSRLDFPVPGARFSLVPNTFRPREAICKNMNHSLYRVAISACFSNVSCLETSSFTRHSTGANNRARNSGLSRSAHLMSTTSDVFNVLLYLLFLMKIDHENETQLDAPTSSTEWKCQMQLKL